MSYVIPMLLLEGKSSPGCAAAAGNDRRQVWRKFFRRGPLVEAGIRPAPHGDLAVAEQLLPQAIRQRHVHRSAYLRTAGIRCWSFRDRARQQAQTHTHEMQRTPRGRDRYLRCTALA